MVCALRVRRTLIQHRFASISASSTGVSRAGTDAIRQSISPTVATGFRRCHSRFLNIIAYPHRAFAGKHLLQRSARQFNHFRASCRAACVVDRTAPRRPPVNGINASVHWLTRAGFIWCRRPPRLQAKKRLPGYSGLCWSCAKSSSSKIFKPPAHSRSEHQVLSLCG